MKHLTFSLLSLILTFSAAQFSYAQTPYSSNIQLTVNPPVLGLWKLTESPAQCTEYYNFQMDDKIIINSGKEWVVGKYSYQFPEYHNHTTPILMWELDYDNNEVDCHGQKIDQSGDANIFSIHWKNHNQMELCDTQSKECFFTLSRVLP